MIPHGKVPKEERIFFVCESEKQTHMITEAQACAELVRSFRRGKRRWVRFQSELLKAVSAGTPPPHWDVGAMRVIARTAHSVSTSPWVRSFKSLRTDS